MTFVSLLTAVLITIAGGSWIQHSIHTENGPMKIFDYYDRTYLKDTYRNVSVHTYARNHVGNTYNKAVAASLVVSFLGVVFSIIGKPDLFAFFASLTGMGLGVCYYVYFVKSFMLEYYSTQHREITK